MNLLWHSNAPWARSGYANQTALFTPRIRDRGHDVRISAFTNEAGVVTWNGMPVLPRFADLYGNDIIRGHVHNQFGGDCLVITLADVWNFEAVSLRGLNAACWTPVDHEPLQPPTAIRLKESEAVPIAMSRHGEAMLRAEGFEPVYIPHGVDTKAFAPLPQKQAREALGWDQDAFIIGMVADNFGDRPGRKAFPQALEAFARFRKRHEDAVLYLHTDFIGVKGYDLAKIVHALRLPAESVWVCDQYRYRLGFPTDYMAFAYSAMDVLTNCSYGEGFGIPMMEAQACGTPVVTTDFGAMPEVGKVGWKVQGIPFWTMAEAWQRQPLAEEIAEAYEKAYRVRNIERVAKEAREHALAYDADKVTEEFWEPALAQLAEHYGLKRLEPVGV